VGTFATTSNQNRIGLLVRNTRTIDWCESCDLSTLNTLGRHTI
jgi:hypothetical protein